MNDARKAIPAKEKMRRRPRVEALLDKSVKYGLVTVVAAPGYGKTQAVAHYMIALSKKLIWFSITESGSSAARLWEDFVSAVRQELAALAEELEIIGYPDSVGRSDAAVKALATAAYKNEQVVLVVDDFANIQDSVCIRFLDRLVKADIENLCVVLISSAHVPIVRRDGDYFPIVKDDLRFSFSEVRDLLRLYEIEAGNRETHEMLRRTEGWPLALNLLIRHANDRQLHSIDYEAHWPLIHTMFQNDFFMVYREAVRWALIKLSLLASFPIELVRQINEDDVDELIGVLSGHMFIDYNFSTNVFTFHKTFREFMIPKQQLLEENERRRVLLLAADFLLARGYFFGRDVLLLPVRRIWKDARDFA